MPLKIEDPPLRMLVLSPCAFPCDSSGAVDVGLVSTGISCDKICLQHQLAKSGFFFPFLTNYKAGSKSMLTVRLKHNPEQISGFSSWLWGNLISHLSQLHVIFFSPIHVRKFRIWKIKDNKSGFTNTHLCKTVAEWWGNAQHCCVIEDWLKTRRNPSFEAGWSWEHDHLKPVLLPPVVSVTHRSSPTLIRRVLSDIWRHWHPIAPTCEPAEQGQTPFCRCP